jgi:hypothetical protein
MGAGTMARSAAFLDCRSVLSGPAKQRMLGSMLASWANCSGFLSACLTRQRCSDWDDPLMTLRLENPYLRGYNVGRDKSIGVFHASVKWPYCGAMALVSTGMAEGFRT